MRKMIKVLPSERQVYNSRKFKSIQEHPLIREKIIMPEKENGVPSLKLFQYGEVQTVNGMTAATKS